MGWKLKAEKGSENNAKGRNETGRKDSVSIVLRTYKERYNLKASYVVIKYLCVF